VHDSFSKGIIKKEAMLQSSIASFRYAAFPFSDIFLNFVISFPLFSNLFPVL